MPRLVEPTDEGIVEAVRQLRRGAIVVFPTETVYGLGADTFNPEAIDAVYALKGRSQDMPLIAHVYDSRQARELVAVWDDRCERLVERFWPGPLTLVLPRADHLPSRATAGRSTIAVRAPAHPVARKLIGGFDGPISAPSANRSGDRSPTTAGHVVADLAEFEDLMVLDGGPCEVGIESTVLDLTPESASEGAPADRPSPPRVLRLGGVSREEIQDVVGLIVDSSPPIHDASAQGVAADPRRLCPRRRRAADADRAARVASAPGADGQRRGVPRGLVLRSRRDRDRASIDQDAAIRPGVRRPPLRRAARGRGHETRPDHH